MDDHERAQVVAALLLTGDGGAEDRAWLESHLATCRTCADVSAGMEKGLAALRSIPLRADPVLVATTKRRVRERASQLREARNRRRWLVVSSLLAAAMTGAAGVSLWQVLGWLSHRLTVAPGVWTPALLALWFLPGILAGAATWAGQSLAVHPRRTDLV